MISVHRVTGGAFRACVLLMCAGAATAQRPVQRMDPEAGPAYATRAMLEQDLRSARGHDDGRDKGKGKGKGKGKHAKAQWADAADLIRARLDSGDFRPGDRILLVVQGEKELSDTFTVGMATDLTLPQIGVVPLTGVLRAELLDRLTQVLRRYLRNPVVHVRSMIRVSVEGEVNRPGFYAIAPETPLMDAFSAAGGLTRDARLQKMRVERDGVIVLGGRDLEHAVRRGRSLDALNLRAGDQVYIPRRPDFTRTAQVITLLLSIPIAIYALTQIHF
jgi:protein involved in polysaccharide export with SLBB domain